MWKNWIRLQNKTDWPENPMVYIGCMTGTSVDCQADFTAAIFNSAGKPLAYYNHAIPLPSTLRSQLIALSKQEANQITAMARAHGEAELSAFLVSAYEQVIKAAGLSHYPREQIVLSPHGQTIDHQPYSTPPYTDILVTGEHLAYHTECRVVTRHRQAPLTVSSAAPLAPVLIKQLFYDKHAATVVINGGGMANLCLLPTTSPDHLIAYDVGPANAPIDELIHYALEKAAAMIPDDLRSTMASKQWDDKGQWASLGRVNPTLMKRLLSHPYFAYPTRLKSVDRASFGLNWVLGDDPTALQRPQDWADHLATLVEVIIVRIVTDVMHSLDTLTDTPSQNHPCRVIVYGGLASNLYAMARLKTLFNQQERPFDFVDMGTLGYDPDFFESLLLAYLGYYAVNQQAIDLSYCRREESRQPAKAIPGMVAFPATFCYKKEPIV